jgi:hypothetical protein
MGIASTAVGFLVHEVVETPKGLSDAADSHSNKPPNGIC